MFDLKHLKLGKKAPRVDPRTLQLSKYIGALPAPPESCDWTQGVTEFGMMLNGPNDFGNGVPSDGLGDCTCAAIGHGVQIARLNSPSGIVTPPDLVIERLYEGACGYVQGNPLTDQGGVIIDVLNYVRKNAPWLKKKRHTGVGHKHPYQLLAYADPNPNNTEHVKQAIATFGIVDIGLQLPNTAQEQVGGVWDVVGNPSTDPNSAPGSWGGHSVIVCAYTPTTLTCITWGALQQMTWNFWNTYVDESHALLFRAWAEKLAVQSPETLEQIEQDLQEVVN